MATTYALKDYKSTYFEYKELDKIHGQPTVNNLLTLFRQRKTERPVCHMCTGRWTIGLFRSDLIS